MALTDVRCVQRVKLTEWILVMCKLAESQMESTLGLADELKQLRQQVEKLEQQNQRLSNTVGQQKSVINSITSLLQQSSTGPTD